MKRRLVLHANDLGEYTPVLSKAGEMLFNAPAGPAQDLRAETIQALIAAKLMMSDLMNSAHGAKEATQHSIRERLMVADIGNRAAAVVAHVAPSAWTELKATASPDHRRHLERWLTIGRRRIWAANPAAAQALGMPRPAPGSAGTFQHSRTRTKLPRMTTPAILIAALPLVVAIVFAIWWSTTTTSTTITLYSDRGETWDIAVSCGGRSSAVDQGAAAKAALADLQDQVGGDLNGRLISVDPGGPGLDGSLTSLTDAISVGCSADKDSAGGPVVLAAIGACILSGFLVIRDRIRVDARQRALAG